MGMVEKIDVNEVMSEMKGDKLFMESDELSKHMLDWIDYEKTKQADVDDAFMQEIADMLNKWIDKNKKVTKEDIALVIAIIKTERRIHG